MDYRKKFSIFNFQFSILRDNSKVILICFTLVLSYLLYKNIVGSVFLKKKDRINVVFYGPTSVFYSLGLDRDINYFFKLPPNAEVEVPGGYGYYRIGALGKLVSLERKSDILKKSFSAISSSFVDLYFYPTAQTVYYEENNLRNNLPSFETIFMNKSNTNILDKALLWYFFLQKTPNQYKEITDLPERKELNRAIFDREGFFKEFQGYFYKKTYRNISDRVQILYTKSYKTALLLSDILEGEGIQVVDLSETSSPQNSCKIITSKKINTDVTLTGLQRFLGCSIQKGTTDVSDIILVLGNLEKEWNVD